MRKPTKKRAPKRAPRKHPLSPEEELSAMLAELEGEEIGAGKLTAHDRVFLARMLRFLSGILTRRFVRRAYFEGYTAEEHAEGWRLFDLASGRHRTLDLAFEGDVDPAVLVDPERQRVFEQIDAFENLWIPRTRALIPRVVPEEHVERFEAAFFRDLSQQPLGPLVVDSVKTYLDRVEALATSKEPGAKELREKLRARGLTDARVRAMRELVESVKAAPLPVARRSEEAREADRLQQEGLKKARAWWNDWATTLRPRFDGREQIVLGLSEVRAERVARAPEAPSGSDPSPES